MPTSRPQALFSADYPIGALLANYDVARDGRLIVMKGRQWLDGQVVNWFGYWKPPGSGVSR